VSGRLHEQLVAKGSWTEDKRLELTLTVTVNGVEHTLQLGGKRPKKGGKSDLSGSAKAGDEEEASGKCNFSAKGEDYTVRASVHRRWALCPAVASDTLSGREGWLGSPRCILARW
jgi:hypothetical protein